MITTDVLILGGGLSGLQTAQALHRNGVDALLVEARSRLGGRILSRAGTDRQANAAPSASFDLGPTWFWPGQERIAALIRKLGLESGVFLQPSDGEALYESPTGDILRGMDGASMAGSFRLEGGLGKLITALASRVPSDKIWGSTRATAITLEGHRISTTVQRDGGEETINSARVVIALPPRLAARTIRFSPELPATRSAELARTVTWMAGQAKVVALYDEPFWRTDGLSGDALSHLGPLGEIHDASPPTGQPSALFGFVGIPTSARDGRQDELRLAALAQLERLFGPRASQPIEVLIKDWAFDPLTATEEDHGTQPDHPSASLDETTEKAWDDRLLWSGAETATEGMRHNGYLEGALEASARTVRQLSLTSIG